MIFELRSMAERRTLRRVKLLLDPFQSMDVSLSQWILSESGGREVEQREGSAVASHSCHGHPARESACIMEEQDVVAVAGRHGMGWF